MDNRKPPDTNVVQLRRNGDPSDEERQRLASTIFAEQDEIGTFSRGNLVPPAATTRACQRPSVSPHSRPSFLPTGGHHFSPLAAIESPHHQGWSRVVRPGA